MKRDNKIWIVSFRQSLFHKSTVDGNFGHLTHSVPNREYELSRHPCWNWKTRFLPIKCSFFRAKFEFVYLLTTAQQSGKGSSVCATPKENTNRIVDEEHFLVFCWQYSLFGTQLIQITSTQLDFPRCLYHSRDQTQSRGFEVIRPDIQTNVLGFKDSNVLGISFREEC